MRRPSTFSAAKRCPANSTLSPSAGTWPRVAEDEAADGVPVLVGEGHAEQLVELVDGQAAVDPQLAVGELLDIVVLDVVLVDDLADQLLEAVLQRDEAGDAAVLVDEERHVELLGLHLAHQAGDRLGLGHEVGRAGQPGHGLEAAALPLGPHEVLGVGDAEHVVDRVAHHGQPGEPVLDGEVEGLGDLGRRALTVTMSGRGTMTSRATVSPNSMMLSMSRRSSCSITSSSAAASTMPSSSCSETNGPCFRPLPGRSTLVRPMRAAVMSRSGGNRTSHSDRAAP